MKCIRTKQIHDYNNYIIYTQYKQHEVSTKHTHTHPPPPPYRYDLTDDVNEAAQLMDTTPYKDTVYIISKVFKKCS